MATQQHIWATHLLHWSKCNGQISSLPPISSKISIPIFENKTHLHICHFFKWSKTLTLLRPMKKPNPAKPTLQSASKHLTDFTRSSSTHSRFQWLGPQRSWTINAQDSRLQKFCCTRNKRGHSILVESRSHGTPGPQSWDRKQRPKDFKKLIPKKMLV